MSEHEAWAAGYKAGRDHERRLWQWQAGELARRVHGLREHPGLNPPQNPYGKEEQQ